MGIALFLYVSKTKPFLHPPLGVRCICVTHDVQRTGLGRTLMYCYVLLACCIAGAAAN